MGRRARAALASIALACGACSAIIGINHLTPGDGADASALDGATEGAPEGAADAENDASGCVNLITNPSFEEGAPCAPWINYGGPVHDSTTARSGAHACGACVGPEGGAVNLLTSVPEHPFSPGEVVHVELWVRAEDSALVGATANLAVGTDVKGLGAPNTIHLTKDYQRISFDRLIPLDAGSPQTASMSLLVRDPADAGGDCILFDDVVVCRDGG